MIRDQIKKEIIDAQKNHDSQTADYLRYLLSIIQNKQIDLKKDLTDEETILLLKDQKKALSEALESFRKAGRDDLVKEYESQIAILLKYLPKELSDEELQKRIQDIINENKEILVSKPKAIIGICVSKLKPFASSERIVSLTNKLIENS